MAEPSTIDSSHLSEAIRMSEWKTVSIRQELIRDIEKIVGTGRYRNLSEFISEAIQLRLKGVMDVETKSTERHQQIGVVENGTVKEALKLKEENSAPRAIALWGKPISVYKHETPAAVDRKETGTIEG
jgi:Arc/MetJ-type ribon-helix-helix transcriptional regulator